MDSQELKKLLDDIINDPSQLDRLSKDEILELRKKTNPYKMVVPVENKSWINISITNLRDIYLRRLHMVSLVGYLFRTLSEYEFEPTLKQLKELSQIESEEEKKKREEEMKKEFEKEKIGAIKFLRRNFDYNPDYHLHISYTENKDDPERVSRFDEYRKRMRISKKSEEIMDSIKKNSDSVAEDLKNSILSFYTNLQRLRQITETLINVMDNYDRDDDLSEIIDETKSMIISEKEELDKLYVEYLDLVKILSSDDIKYTLSVGIPSDAFYQWDRYITNHYEDLREVVNILYNEKPDMEYAIQYMGTFSKEEDAIRHRQKWEKRLISSVITIENGGWSLLGPFKKNRERIDFYNKNTEILKQIANQIEADHKIGEEFMKKRIKQKKKRDIIQHGLDDKGLNEYINATNVLETLGAKRVLSEDEKRQYFEARKIVDNAETPDNALEIDVFYTDEKGMQRKKFYTEAIEFTEEETEPVTGMAKKMIQSRHGEYKSIKEFFE